MKRYGHLFEKAFTREALYQAFLDASKHKHGKRSCFNFERRLAFNLDKLYQSLHDGSYRPQPYYTFMVYEPKPRRIYAPSFADLVVQHAIYRVILPIFDASFIGQSFACRPGYGTHAAADYSQRALQACHRDSYTLKLDIRKFFYRITRTILRTRIERKIKDRRFVDLMMLFADYGELLGIPIGNLLSQLFALIFLDPLDHFIKRVLKIRHYCRYVDDFILFGLTRAEAEQHKVTIEAWLAKELNLELSRFTIARCARGVNFVGYRTWASRRFVRKHSLFKLNRAASRDQHDSVVSILGHAKHTHSLRHLVALLKEKYHVKALSLPKDYRRIYNLHTQPAG